MDGFAINVKWMNLTKMVKNTVWTLWITELCTDCTNIWRIWIQPDRPWALQTPLYYGVMEQQHKHRRRNSSTPWKEKNKRKQTHRGWGSKGQHALKRQRERERETRAEAEFPGRWKYRSKTSGLRHRQPGEKENSGQLTVQHRGARVKREDKRERVGSRKRYSHSCACGAQTN